MSLIPGSIHNFEGLAKRRFLTHIIGSMKVNKHFTHLSTVKEWENEVVRTFITRWKKEVQSMEGLDYKSALAMFIESLRSSSLYVSLRADTLASYALAIWQANIFTREY